MRQRLGREAHGPADRHVGDLPAVVAARRRSCRERDPDNRLLARQAPVPARRRDGPRQRPGGQRPARRRQIGGPSVKPYQPAGYWAFLNFPTREYGSTTRATSQYRRGLYTYWQRTFLHPSLLAFDAPSREECTAERPRSNTPQQALVLLNDPTYVEAARAFAARIVREGGHDDRRRGSTWACRQALSRPPRPAEARACCADLLDEAPRPSTPRDRDAGRRRCSTSAQRPAPDGHRPGRAGRLDLVARVDPEPARDDHAGIDDPMQTLPHRTSTCPTLAHRTAGRFLGRSRRAGLGVAGAGLAARPGACRTAGRAADRWRASSTRCTSPPKAKRVICLYMAGGPSHLETFDHKPKLAEMHGQPMPESFTKGQPIAQLQGQKLNCFGPQHAFKKFGKSGQEICELFPHIGDGRRRDLHHPLDDTEAINHDPAHTFMNTGTHDLRPAGMGSWVYLRPGQREPTTCPASSC